MITDTCPRETDGKISHSYPRAVTVLQFSIEISLTFYMDKTFLIHVYVNEIN